MASMNKFFTLAIALAVMTIGGFAQAETITYTFTAQITHECDVDDVIGANVGDEVHGTFSFDTDAAATVRDGRRIDVSYRDTGDIESDLVVIQGGTDGVYWDGTTIVDSSRRDRDLIQVADSERGTSVTNLTSGDTTDVRFAVESVTFYFGDADALNSTDLPTSLNLNDFDGAQYVVSVVLENGDQAYAIGRITSVERSSTAAAVPELSATGTASSVTLLLGGAYVIQSRRRRGAAS